MKEIPKKRKDTRITEISQELMLNIDQISQITGVRKCTLRYWEKSLDDSFKPSRTPTNRRAYSLEDLDRAETIKRLLEQDHLTMHGVRLRLLNLSSMQQGGGGKRKDDSEPENSSP